MLKKQLLEKAEQENSFYPLSYGQRALFFLYLNSPESSSYNVAFTARILSKIDLDSLRKAFQKLINRHPVLRTTFLFKEGKPVQEVHVYREISIEEIDATGLSEEQLYQQVKEAYSVPFDLENGPVFRVHLFKISEENTILLINMHHILSDGWSLGIILNETGTLYQAESEGKHNSLPKLQTTYFDYVKKHDEMLSSSKGEELWSYWKEELSGSNTKLDLPYDRQRPESPTTDGSMVYISIDHELTSALRAFAKSEGVTIYNLLLTAYLVLLHKYSNQNDILIGTTTAGRNIPDTKDIAGYFVNPVVIRGNFSEETTFKSFLNQTRKTVLGALEHQDFPFSLLVEKLMPVREPGLSPVFQAEFGLYKIQPGNDILNLMSAGSKGKQVVWGNLKAEYYELRQQEGQFDLLLELQETEERISGYLKYSTDVFEQDTISKMSERYKNLLQNILKYPDRKISELNLILNEEKNLILGQWNNTEANYPSLSTIHELFEKQATAVPGNTAVVFGNKILKYSDLKKDSDLFANYLRNEYKVKRNDLICVLMDKSEYMIVTLLAILKAGGAYVPVDPDYPQERINYILGNCKSKIIISNSEHIDKIGKEFNGVVIDSEMIQQKLKDESPVEIRSINEPDDTAYIIYTSGTTGNPKGCRVTHSNVVRLMVNDKMPFEFNEKDVWIMAHSFCFDFSVWEMYGALLYGGKLIVPVKDEVRVITDFLSLIKEHKVTILNQTPLAFYNLISEERSFKDRNLDSHLRYVIFGGDKLEPAKLKDWCTAYSLNKIQLINMYGITETTVHVTFYRLKESDISSLRYRSPIGKPIPETTVYVFDKYFNLLPPGIRGEFYVGGTGVSKGYLFNDELTAQRFIKKSR
ncbi:MAG: AMP-binding protein [Ignavibacteria bacterium]|nr:AMP-binding protein [Ignavibacteria bacterium]